MVNSETARGIVLESAPIHNTLPVLAGGTEKSLPPFPEPIPRCSIRRRNLMTKTTLTLAVLLAVSAGADTFLQAANPIVPEGAKLEKLFTRTASIQGGLTEGPAVAPDGSIYFSDIPFGEDKGQILRFDPKTGQTSVFTEDSRKSNGLCFDADGNLVAAEGADYGGRAIARYDLKTGKRTVIADSYRGKRFNAPNDMYIDIEGRIYFSDPRYLGHEPRELEHRAVMRVETDGSVTLVTKECEKPNGITLSPDQRTLYVADHNNGTDRIGFGDEVPKPGAMRIYAFPLGPDGLPNGPRKTLQDYGTEAGCDGMTADRQGNIYLTLRSLKRPGISVINPKGQEIAFIPTGPGNQDPKDGDPVGLPSNVRFGIGEEISTLYVTIDKSLYRIRLKVPGFHIPLIDSQADRGWERIILDREFRSEGVAVGDLNGDGHNDVVAGDVWYEAPANASTGDWKMHGFRPVGKFVAGKGYSNSFANFVHDFDDDGKLDICVVGFPGDPFHWYRNPGKAGGKWTSHEIWSSICNESPQFADITGDGKPEFIFGSQPEARMGFSPIAKDVTKKWAFHYISEPGDPHKNGTFKYYHGLGYGDLNQDGRTDVLIAHGYWSQPKDPAAGPWPFHPYVLGRDGVNPERLGDIHIDDLDLDGDMDVIGSSAHAFGVWWFENVGSSGKPQFKAHTIQNSNSQTHSMWYIDINGDGQKDIVTGKRFFAHNGGDPGARDPSLMYWFEVKKKKGAAPQFIAHEIVAGRNTGIGTQFQCGDFNGDGRVDIALSNKKGVNLLLQR